VNERRYRSLVKGISWRVIGTVDTTLLSWLFTGALHKAVRIGSIEFFTKIFLFYLHERIWLKVPWARTLVEEDGVLVPRDEHRRSVAKGLSWRITGTIDTIIIAFLVTGRGLQALSIGLTEVATKLVLYYWHERIWQRLNFGRHHATPSARSDAGKTGRLG
jgi:uncharacterized membrane protein